MLVNNPIFSEAEEPLSMGSEYRVQVLKRVPQLVKLDGIPVDVDEREAAKAGVDARPHSGGGAHHASSLCF